MVLIHIFILYQKDSGFIKMNYNDPIRKLRKTRLKSIITNIIKCSMSGDQLSNEGALGLAVKKKKPELSSPKLFQVVLLNDDYTPMDFVVEVLKMFFYMNDERATQVMLDVHIKGRGVCGIYTKDIAETKMQEVNMFAQENEHPLKCSINPVD